MKLSSKLFHGGTSSQVLLGLGVFPHSGAAYMFTDTFYLTVVTIRIKLRLGNQSVPVGCLTEDSAKHKV